MSVQIFDETPDFHQHLTVSGTKRHRTDRRDDVQFVSLHAFSKGGKRQNCMTALIGVGTMSEIAFRHTTTIAVALAHLSRSTRISYTCPGTFDS